MRYRFTTCGRSVFLRIRQKRSPPSRRRSDRFRSGVESGEESSSCEKPCSSCGGQARAHLADSKKDLLLWARLAPVEQPRVVSKVLRNARPCRSDKHERNPILSDPPPPPCPPSRPPPPRCAREAASATRSAGSQRVGPPRHTARKAWQPSGTPVALNMKTGLAVVRHKNHREAEPPKVLRDSPGAPFCRVNT